MATYLSDNSQQVICSGALDCAYGRLRNNFPVDVAKQMGTNATVRVHIESAPLKPDATLSSVAALSQPISVVIAVNVKKSMEKADLVISVPLQALNFMDYKGELQNQIGRCELQRNRVPTWR